MLIIGLTGTTGSGKGYVSAFLQGNDTVIIDTDKVYHSMISAPGKCVDALVNEFGDSVRSDSGGIDRAELSKIVFADKERLNTLNRITHKMILDRTREIIADAADKKFAIVDAPLLFESGFDKECDITLGVTAPPEIRIERIMKRDSITYDRALARVRNQKEDSFYKENCDYVIVNDGSDIHDAVNDFKTEMTRLYGEKEKKAEKEN